MHVIQYANMFHPKHIEIPDRQIHLPRHLCRGHDFASCIHAGVD